MNKTQNTKHKTQEHIHRQAHTHKKTKKTKNKKLFLF